MSVMRGRGEKDIAELIRRSRQGDREAFAEIVNLYKNLVYSISNQFLMNAEDANDAAQETFVRIYRSLSKYDEQRDFVPWLYRIACNTALIHLKRRERRRFFVTPESHEEASRALATASAIQPHPADEDEKTQIVRQVLAALPLKFRIICTLRYLEDKSYEEIAEITGLPRSTVRGRLNRAKKLVEKRLKNALPGFYGSSTS